MVAVVLRVWERLVVVRTLDAGRAQLKATSRT